MKVPGRLDRPQEGPAGVRRSRPGPAGGVAAGAICVERVVKAFLGESS